MAEFIFVCIFKKRVCVQFPSKCEEILCLCNTADSVHTHAVPEKQVQANVSILCHLCHLQLQTHFTASPIWCQQLETVSLVPPVSSQ